MGAHDDDKKTTVHDVQAQVEAGRSSSHLQNQISWSQFASKSKGTEGMCEVSRKVDTQKDNKKKATKTNL